MGWSTFVKGYAGNPREDKATGIGLQDELDSGIPCASVIQM